MYATRATDDQAKRVKNVILRIKSDRLDSAGTPVVRIAIARIAARLSDEARSVFAGGAALVPVPGAGLTKPHSVWPARRICEEILGEGLGQDVPPIIFRTLAVPKSAGSAERPGFDQHLNSLSVQGGLNRPSRIVVVDDVVTSGTTLLACAVILIWIVAIDVDVRRSSAHPDDHLQIARTKRPRIRSKVPARVVVKGYPVPLTNSARWTFNSAKDELELENALTVTLPGGALLPQDQWTHGWWLFYPERSWSGVVRLPLNPDTDAAFLKINEDATSGS